MNNLSKKDLSGRIKQIAFEIGFDLCGIAKARRLSEYGPHFNNWLKAGMNDKMGYLARNFERRLDPGSLFPDAKSLVVTGLSYYSDIRQKDPEAPVLSRYTYGSDYHDVIFEKLEKLLARIREIEPEAEGRSFVDSAPLLEKAWAREAGLGWQGRHSILINKDIGSFFFIGTLILNLDLDYDAPFKNEYCKGCRICIEKCPTGAINDNRTIDARKCIANVTIENRGPIPEDLIPKLGKRIYGCDRCQEVCPWNNKAKPKKTPEFQINETVANMSLNDWLNLSAEQFTALFSQSAIGRVKYQHLMKNIEAAVRSSETSNQD